MSWSEFVSRVIGAESHEKVGSRIGVSGPTVGRWINGSTGAPRVEVAVRFARTYRVSVLEAFVEAGYITAREAGVPPSMESATEADLDQLTNDELIDLVRKRMGSGSGETTWTGAGAGRAPSLDKKERDRHDSAPTTTEDPPNEGLGGSVTPLSPKPAQDRPDRIAARKSARRPPQGPREQQPD